MKTLTIQVSDDYEVKIIKKEDSKENNLIIRTYQDLIDNKIILDNAYWINTDSIICNTRSYPICDRSKNMSESKKVIKSMLAMAMISQLMPYYGGMITNEEWADGNVPKYIIERYTDHFDVDTESVFYHFLAFHTEEQRDNFIKYNEQLVKDYLMLD